jgi:hypothetical protein
VIQHVSLECHRDDADAHRSFWSALGFTEVTPPESLRERSMWLQSGATQIHLLWADEPVVPPQGHVAVCVPDLEATLAALAGFVTENRTQHWGEPRHYAYAPGGHVVELFAVSPDGRGR